MVLKCKYRWKKTYYLILLWYVKLLALKNTNTNSNTSGGKYKYKYTMGLFSYVNTGKYRFWLVETVCWMGDQWMLGHKCPNKFATCRNQPNIHYKTQIYFFDKHKYIFWINTNMSLWWIYSRPQPAKYPLQKNKYISLINTNKFLWIKQICLYDKFTAVRNQPNIHHKTQIYFFDKHP